MRIPVIGDDRKPTSVIENLRSHPEVAEVAVKRLSAGDIVIESVAIERKTPRD
jgi:ERCC4-type nuclease